MKENMIFNDDQYQLREFQVDRMKEVIVNNRISKENGVVFYGDSIVQGYDINKYIPEINDKYNCGIEMCIRDRYYRCMKYISVS